MRKEFPILEFDESREAMITAQKLEGRENVGVEYGVICFKEYVREQMAREYPSEVVGQISGCGLSPEKIYKINYNGTEIILTQGLLGGPLAAGTMEELVALGCKKVVAVGSAGVLDKEISRGKIIVPTAAVRQDGASYHYAPPSREIVHDPKVIEAICQYLSDHHLPYVLGKTWTTDAIFRETKNLVQMRKEEGCLCVDMENATFGAVAQFYGIKFGQILYGADCLDGELWDMRYWSCEEVRQKSQYEFLKLAMELVQKI